MESTDQLSAMLATLMFGAMLAAYTQVVALRRKGRDDRRRYQERMRRNHGAPRGGAMPLRTPRRGGETTRVASRW